MFGGRRMNFMNNLSPNETNSYINHLINQVYSILPLYEEGEEKDILALKIHSISLKIDGFFEQKSFNNILCVDILSLIAKLERLESHDEVRTCVLKICNLLSDLKSGGVKNA